MQPEDMPAKNDTIQMVMFLQLLQLHDDVRMYPVHEIVPQLTKIFALIICQQVNVFIFKTCLLLLFKVWA